MGILLLMLFPIMLLAAPIGIISGIVLGLASGGVLSWKIAIIILIVGSLVWGLIAWKIIKITS